MSSRSSSPSRPVDTALELQIANTIRGLTMDAVEAAGCGHPGMPMGAAEMATVLWSEFLVHDPSAPHWPDRDRFVLSAGHGSLLLYSLLHLTTYDLSLAELRQFRQWGSRTPGHPEVGHTPGVEITTGPLGTGFASGVGMAIAERFLADHYNRDGHTVVDHLTYGIVGDGDLMEGVSAEAASLAGHLGLGKLIYMWDDNRVSIDGGTEITFTEDTRGRFRAYGWQVLDADGHDPAAIREAIAAARANTGAPSLICCRTVIGKGSPNKAGSSDAHGAKLGAAEVAATKQAMSWPPTPFHVPAEVREAMQAARGELRRARERWEAGFAAYRRAEPELAAQFELLQRGELPAGVLDALPSFADGTKVATRKASGKVIAALSAVHPTFLGGSADLAGSNCAEIPGSPDQSRATPGGRNLRFGVREHAMGAVCNGIALHGGARCFDATFLVFCDFMRGALRLSALMGLPVVHVLTHDSFWLGEDGPTHQPIEHIMSLRAIPGLAVVRPADARETAGAWRLALQRSSGPTAILLSRQDLPVLAGSRDDLSRGAYVIHEPATPPRGILIATGSEVSLAIDAARALEQAGDPVRVVSMPCWEQFEAQDAAYREQILPRAITRRLAVEAGATLGWSRYAGDVLGIDRFGASAPAEVLAEQFGFTVAGVVARYRALA